jgi:hypothetical protein
MDRRLSNTYKQVGFAATVMGSLLMISLPGMAMPQLLSQSSMSPNSATGTEAQPPLPESLQSPKAVVVPVNGMITVKLDNATGADITYQVIGNTKPRLLQRRSSVTLQGLPTPTTVTFRRKDGGLLRVSPRTSTQNGLLEVTFTKTTSLSVDKTTMTVQRSGGVFLN